MSLDDTGVFFYGLSIISSPPLPGLIVTNEPALFEALFAHVAI